MKVFFKDKVWKKMRKVSKDEFPNEAASLLIGRKKNEVFKVEKMIEAKNSQRSRISFQIDPQFLVDTLDKFEGMDMELIGFYHSHPNLHAFVSERDEKFMKLWPGRVWVIGGTDDRGEVTEVRAFVWKEGVERVNVESKA